MDVSTALPPTWFYHYKDQVQAYSGSQSAIAHVYNTTVLKEKSDDDAEAWLSWVLDDESQQERKEAELTWAQPPMTMRQYLCHLRSLDLYNVRSIDKFFSKTLTRINEKPCNPIVLGFDGGMTYHLKSGIIRDVLTETLPDEQDQHEWLSGIKPTIPRTASPARYILFLGSLCCVPSQTYSKIESEDFELVRKEQLETPFMVGLNLVDNALWIVLATVHYSSDPDVEPVAISRKDDTWKFLHTPADNRKTFDMMQIMTWEELCNIDFKAGLNRKLFTKASLRKAKRIGPIQIPVTEQEVEMAIEKASNGIGDHYSETGPVSQSGGETPETDQECEESEDDGMMATVPSHLNLKEAIEQEHACHAPRHRTALEIDGHTTNETADETLQSRGTSRMEWNFDPRNGINGASPPFVSNPSKEAAVAAHNVMELEPPTKRKRSPENVGRSKKIASSPEKGAEAKEMRPSPLRLNGTVDQQPASHDGTYSSPDQRPQRRGRQVHAH